eukprot:1161976-Pelagomonas_calceolata.AAC.2
MASNWPGFPGRKLVNQATNKSPTILTLKSSADYIYFCIVIVCFHSEDNQPEYKQHECAVLNPILFCSIGSTPTPTHPLRGYRIQNGAMVGCESF